MQTNKNQKTIQLNQNQRIKKDRRVVRNYYSFICIEKEQEISPALYL